MNFDVSSSNFSTNIGTVSVSNGAKINYKTKQFTVDEVDYSDSVVDEEQVTLGELGDLLTFMTNRGLFWNNYIRENMIGDTVRTLNTKETFVVEKSTTTVGWATTKWVWADLASALIGTKAKESIGWTCLSIFATAAFEGGHKVGIKGLSGLFADKDVRGALWGELGKGFTKSATSALMKDNPLTSAIVKTFSKIPLPKNLKLGDLAKIIDKAGWKPIKPGSFWDKIMSKDIRKFSSNKTKKNKVTKFTGKFSGTTLSVGDFASSLGSAFGIDYISGLASNIVGGLINGDDGLTWEEVALGSTALKSSTKIIFATAGEFAFGKAGKIVGTAVGAFIGEFQVAMFTDEEGNIQEGWCAAAGAMQLAGGVVGVAVVALLVSNPAGWVVGLAIIVGAAVGFVVTWVAKELIENIGRVIDAVEAVAQTAQFILEEAVDFVGNVVDDIANAVKADPVADFLIGWAF